MSDTIVTAKGTITIPPAIRRQLGIEAGALLSWTVRDGVTEARKKAGALNALQRHIRERVDLDFEAAWRAGLAIGRVTPRKGERVVLPDFLIRSQAEALGCRHLTKDRRHLSWFPGVQFVFPENRHA